MTSKKLIVGISGVTNGGKSTLVKQLLELLHDQSLHVKLLTQDDYFYPEDSPNHVPAPPPIRFSHHNWDIITSLNMDKMVADVESFQRKPIPSSSVLLLDGFILYDDHRIFERCDLKFFITLNREECQRRRETRVYDPPDIPGYFEHCVWPMYEAHVERLKSLNSIIYLDGSLPPESILQVVYSNLLDCLKK